MNGKIISVIASLAIVGGVFGGSAITARAAYPQTLICVGGANGYSSYVPSQYVPQLLQAQPIGIITLGACVPGHS